jgi:alkaline phosphatase D
MLVPFVLIVLVSLIVPLAHAATFTSSFETTDTGRFVGPEYWANPLEAWTVHDGQVFVDGNSIIKKKDVNLPLLTHQIENPADGFELETSVRLIDNNNETDTDSVDGTWVGFYVGMQGAIDDYRHSLVRHQTRFKAGIRTADGKLFLQHPSLGIRTSRNPVPWDVFGPTHQLVLSYQERYLRLSVTNADNNDSEDSIFVQVKIDPSHLEGVVALAAFSCKAVFSQWSVSGNGVVEHSDQVFGPIAWTQYTLDESNSVLKLNVQMMPVSIPSKVYLEFRSWEEAKWAAVDYLSRTALFRVDNWNTEEDQAYRVKYIWSNNTYYYYGIIRKSPRDKDTLSIAAFSCDHGYAFPLPRMTRNVRIQDPDLVLFAGDQIYEHVGGYGCRREGPTDLAMMDYLYKWYLFGWTWRDVLRDRPSVIIVDE